MFDEGRKMKSNVDTYGGGVHIFYSHTCALHFVSLAVLVRGENEQPNVKNIAVEVFI